MTSLPEELSSSTMVPWRIAGSYFESCNCDAICPCRMVGGVPGGRSTYGECFGILSWLVERGHAGDVDLSGLGAVLVMQYDDDEEGSPWRFIVHVDDRGDEEQRDALAGILLGRLGGEQILSLPWVRKVSELLDVRSSRIEIRSGPEGRTVRVGENVSLTSSRKVETDEPVACIISGYDRIGTELYAEELSVDDKPFQWTLSGNCAFVADFEYSSA